MIMKNTIEKALDEAIIKCGPTIKQRFNSFDSKEYKSERYSKKLGQIRSAEKSPVGALQQRQEDLQDEIDYTNAEKSMLSSYSISTFWNYNAYFNHHGLMSHNDTKYGREEAWKLDVYKWEWEDYYDEEYGRTMSRRKFHEPLEYKEFNIYDFSKYPSQKIDYTNPMRKISLPQSVEILDNMIDKSPPLQENTLLYRVGVFDENLQAGDTAKFKNYTSTSFNSYVAKNGIKKYAGFDPSDDCYQLKIYAPKGTKGVVPCENTGCEDWQSEFTLARNQKYIVISVDYVKKTAELLLY